jgi:ATP-dependent DNA helicase RecQ
MNSNAILRGESNVMISQIKERLETKQQQYEYEPELFQKLKDVRRRIALQENVPAYIVLSDATLMELATFLPQTLTEFSRISGFGEVKLARYGNEFLRSVTAFASERGLPSRIHLKSPKRQRRDRPERETDTKLQSLQLFKLGHSLQKIAAMREISQSTVEGHLAFYVQQGTLAIEQIMDVTKVPTIQNMIEKLGSQTIGPIKEALGEGYSYGEIRLTMAYDMFLKTPHP